MDIDRCVVCGNYVPEGRMIWSTCEKETKTDHTNFHIALSEFIEIDVTCAEKVLERWGRV